MNAPMDTDARRQRAAQEMIAYLRSPEDPSKWRLLEPQDLPYLERLSIAAEIPLLLYRVNLSSLTAEEYPLGYVPPPPAPLS